jgi:hypothetical protein
LSASSDNLSGLAVTSGLRFRPISCYDIILIVAPQKLNSMYSLSALAKFLREKLNEYHNNP